MFGQHRHQADDQRQLAVVGAGQIETDTACAGYLRLRDLYIISAVVRPAFVAQQFPGENHVGGCHRPAVGKTRTRIDRERDIGTCIVGFDTLGEQGVERERLVVAAREQALDRVVFDMGGGQAFDDERIEAVECAEHAMRQLPALARGRIGVARIGEIRSPSRLAMHGDGMPRGRGGGRTGTNAGGCQQCAERATQQRAARRLQMRHLRRG